MIIFLRMKCDNHQIITNVIDNKQLSIIWFYTFLNKVSYLRNGIRIQWNINQFG